jgi:nucleoside-diphosphate-sugar epimerase
MGLTIYGGTGFIGYNYYKSHGESCFLNGRSDYTPKSKDILYFISTTDNYNVFTDPHLDINTNLNVLVDVLEEYRKSNMGGIFNFISSWFVYGNTELPASENSICNPNGFYSITKRAAEQLLVSYCETFGIKYRILRLGNVVGKGDANVSAKKNALQFLINKMKKNETVELYDGGEFHRDYIHINDCVDAIKLIVTSAGYNSIYNVSNGYPVLFKEAINMAHKALNSKSEIISIPQKEFHKTVQVKNMYMSNVKLKHLGYIQKYDLREIIQDLIN